MLLAGCLAEVNDRRVATLYTYRNLLENEVKLANRLGFEDPGTDSDSIVRPFGSERQVHQVRFSASVRKLRQRHKRNS